MKDKKKKGTAYHEDAVHGLRILMGAIEPAIEHVDFIRDYGSNGRELLLKMAVISYHGGQTKTIDLSSYDNLVSACITVLAYCKRRIGLPCEAKMTRRHRNG